MIIIEEKYFHQIAIERFAGMIVILDIDGTLTCSSQKIVGDHVRKKVASLQKICAVYVFSNNYNSRRSRDIARDLCVPYIEAPHKKPNKKIMHYIDRGTTPVVAIGDKYLTDALFASFAGVQHVRVRRYRCSHDSIFDRAACFFDDIIYRFAHVVGLVHTR